MLNCGDSTTKQFVVVDDLYCVFFFGVCFCYFLFVVDCDVVVVAAIVWLHFLLIRGCGLVWM